MQEAVVIILVGGNRGGIFFVRPLWKRLFERPRLIGGRTVDGTLLSIEAFRG